MPEVMATAASDGRMKNVVGVRRLATSTRAGTSRARRTRLITMPMYRSKPVQVPPVMTCTNCSRNRLWRAIAATRTKGGRAAKAKLQRSRPMADGGMPPVWAAAAALARGASAMGAVRQAAPLENLPRGGPGGLLEGGLDLLAHVDVADAAVGLHLLLDLRQEVGELRAVLGVLAHLLGQLRRQQVGEDVLELLPRVLRVELLLADGGHDGGLDVLGAEAVRRKRAHDGVPVAGGGLRLELGEERAALGVVGDDLAAGRQLLVHVLGDGHFAGHGAAHPRASDKGGAAQGSAGAGGAG